MSPMLKVAEHRGKEIVQEIFKALNSTHGHLLMRSDCRALYAALKEPDEKRRVVCDFMAGMTDRYAIQFYGRLFGTNPESIYSPL
jgi:dGTPase